MTRRASVERRVIGLVAEARLVIGDYGVRPLSSDDIGRLLEVFNTTFAIGDLEGLPAILFPPIAGRFRIALDSTTPLLVRRYLLLHELGHVLSGEADEPILMIHDGPLPDSEDVCDLFALLGIIDPFHDEHGTEWVDREIRNLVPLDDYGFQTYRIPRLARKLPRVREMVRNLHGYF
jgi:hypothetical protein